jgi:uncharacterized protein (DUF2336 family)
MSNFALLSGLASKATSEERRDLLRLVTDSLTIGPPISKDELEELDQMLALVTREFSVQVRAELARALAHNSENFSLAAETLALDQLVVAEPVLRHSRALSEATLLKVVNGTSQQHMMLVSKRPDVTSAVSYALVEKGEDDVVSSLLQNENASIAVATYDAIAARADRDTDLKASLIRRNGLPLELLSGLYLKVEASLRQEIISRFGNVPESEVTAAFVRSRTRLTTKYRDVPGDFEPARKRVRDLASRGKLLPPILMKLLREGAASRTAFIVALSELADVDFEVVQRTTEGPDLDALALITRGAGFDRGLFTSLAVGLDRTEAGLSRALEYGTLFDHVPAQTAERAMRFWKLSRSALQG